MGRAARSFSFSISTASSSLRFGHFLRRSQIASSEILTCTQVFLSEIGPLTHPAANGENVGMNKGIVEETVYVFLFRCEKCNRPIISWMLSPRHGGYSLEKAQTKALPLTCVMKECGWSAARFGRDAIESWAVPWTYTATGPFDQS